MFRKIRRTVLKQFKFRVTMIDGHSYEVYAVSFSNALTQHRAKFAYDPRFIYPLDNISGTNALTGANRFAYRVHLHVDVTAETESHAVEQFSKKVNRNSVLVEQQHPVWVNERED